MYIDVLVKILERIITKGELELYQSRRKVIGWENKGEAKFLIDPDDEEVDY
jgi:hypothetical protein